MQKWKSTHPSIHPSIHPLDSSPLWHLCRRQTRSKLLKWNASFVEIISLPLLILLVLGVFLGLKFLLLWVLGNSDCIFNICIPNCILAWLPCSLPCMLSFLSSKNVCLMLCVLRYFLLFKNFHQSIFKSYFSLFSFLVEAMELYTQSFHSSWIFISICMSNVWFFT